MFTGIVEEIGKINKINSIAGGISIKVDAFKILEDISVNDSICIDGVCLTVVRIEPSAFLVEAVGATLEKTTFSEIKESANVNLERSVRLNDRLGGHLVQGHINGVGSISGIQKLGENYLFKVTVPKELEKYVIKEGSIAINGISLTIADIENNEISISIIPHTWQNTTLKYKQVLDKVNVEIDILAKYVEKLLLNNEKIPAKNISEKWLKELGY